MANRIALWLIKDGTGEHYRTKLYKLEHLDPKSETRMDTMDPRSITWTQWTQDQCDGS